MLLIGLNKQSGIRMILHKRSRNFSADVFLNCFDYIGFILPQASKTILLDSKIVKPPIVTAISW
jgi:hypothetical protein